MSPAPMLVSRRHHAKSPLSTVTNVSRMPSSSLSTKRPFANDENADPALFKRSPPKRVKSDESPSSVVPTPTTAPAKTPRFVPTDKLPSPPKRRAFGVLSNITNTHNRIEKKSSTTTTTRPSKSGALLKKSLNASSPPTPTSRRKSQSPIVESRRAHKRARSPGAPAQRVGRTTATTSQLSESVTTAVLEHDTPSPHPSTDNNNNNSETSAEVSPTATMLQPMPSSWTFEIYEDTAEETLQNLMEFSTHTLNISSSSSSSSSPDESESELSQKGKENIPPARLLEIFSAPIELAMSVDTPEKLIPQQREGATRPALRELTPEEVGGPIAPEGEEVVLEEDEDESTPVTPAKECSPSGRYEFGSGDKSPKWAVWEAPTPVTTTPIVEEEEAENEENTPPKVLSLTKAYNLLEKKKKMNKMAMMNKKTTPTTSARGRQQPQQQQKGMFEKENYSGSKSKLSGGIRGMGGMFGGMGMGMGKRRGVEVFVDAV